MKKTVAHFLFLLIITGAIFTGCLDDDVVVEDEVEVVEEVEDVEESGDEDEVEAKDGVVVEDGVVEVEMVEEPEPAVMDSGDAGNAYVDGDYSVAGSYVSPAGAENIVVDLTLKEDVVTSVVVTPQSANEVTQNFQGLFADGASAVVVGKKLDDIDGLSVVNGSSLTPGGFNDAVSKIKMEALVAEVSS